MTRIQRETIAYLLITGFCIWMLTWAIPTYTPPYPGYGASPALVPNVSVGIMLVMVSLALVRIAMARFMNKPIPPEEAEFPEDLSEESGFTQVGRVKLLHLAMIMIPSALLVVAVDYVGYMPSAFVFLMIFQFAIGSRKWIQSTVVAVVLVITLYVVMRYGFGVPVPGPQLF